jgi:hypothetical protein
MKNACDWQSIEFCPSITPSLLTREEMAEQIFPIDA